MGRPSLYTPEIVKDVQKTWSDFHKCQLGFKPVRFHNIATKMICVNCGKPFIVDAELSE